MGTYIERMIRKGISGYYWEPRAKMRTPEQIDVILAEIGEIWKKYPSLRLCQLVANLMYSPSDLYFTEDRELIAKLRKYGKSRRR
jgi:hypothetical protein